MSIFTTSIHTVLKVLDIAIKQEKQKASKLEMRKQNCHCLQMTQKVYIESDIESYIDSVHRNPIDSTKKLLNLVSQFGKIAGYKVKIQKSQAFLYNNKEISETEIRKKIPFNITTRKIKHLGIYLTKEVKDLYSENYTTLKKEIKETQTNGSVQYVHGLEELTLLTCPYYQKQFIDLTQSLLKYQ